MKYHQSEDTRTQRRNHALARKAENEAKIAALHEENKEINVTCSKKGLLAFEIDEEKLKRQRLLAPPENKQASD